MTDIADMVVRLADVQDELAAIDGQICMLKVELEVLEQRREKVRAFDEMFQEFVSTRSTADVPSEEEDEAGDAEQPPVADFQASLTIVEGAERALKAKQEWTDTRGLIRWLEEIGIKSQAANAYTSIFGTLNRDVKRDNSKLTKLNGQWGLREWLSEPEEEEESGSDLAEGEAP